jgi:hypothetical protein
VRENPSSVVCGHDMTESERARERESERAREQDSEGVRKRERVSERKCESEKERERESIVGRLWTRHDTERESKSGRELQRVRKSEE